MDTFKIALIIVGIAVACIGYMFIAPPRSHRLMRQVRNDNKAKKREQIEESFKASRGKSYCVIVRHADKKKTPVESSLFKWMTSCRARIVTVADSHGSRLFERKGFDGAEPEVDFLIIATYSLEKGRRLHWRIHGIRMHQIDIRILRRGSTNPNLSIVVSSDVISAYSLDWLLEDVAAWIGSATEAYQKTVSSQSPQ